MDGLIQPAILASGAVMPEPKSAAARYAFGYSDRKPGRVWRLIHAAMFAFVIYNAVTLSSSHG